MARYRITDPQTGTAREVNSNRELKNVVFYDNNCGDEIRLGWTLSGLEAHRLLKNCNDDPTRINRFLTNYRIGTLEKI